MCAACAAVQPAVPAMGRLGGSRRLAVACQSWQWDAERS